MTQLQISKAHETLVELYKIKFPTQISKPVYVLKNLTKDTWEFMSNEETKIIQSYNGILNNDGSFLFSGENAKERYEKCFSELNQLHNLEVELAFIPITITKAESNDKPISGEMIEKLEGFVIFE